ncbi:MAG: ParB N-terminal domain-containing protein [Candidatus Bathyarchaeia archaeon]|jgi:ParB-like chromosome segregation protein Spo0J/DNA-directed RNA polymerase subunit RPC12/RpoP
MMSLRLNPQYEKMLPTMTQEEFEQLKESIRTEGQHYPIIANEELEVLDGHHRFRACTELGLEPDFEIRKFDDKLIEKKFVIEANLRRRHLNNFQLVELAVPLLEIEKALAKKRQSVGGKNGRNSQLGIESDDAQPLEPLIKAKAAEVVAKKAGVSTRTLERGKKIIENASEEDKQALREGKTSISKVYREITPPKPKPVDVEPEQPAFDLKTIRNREAFAVLVKSLIAQDLFCPECGSKIFQCSQCHKPISELAKTQEPPPKQAVETPPQPQMQKNKQQEEPEDSEPLADEEGFKDEFF